MSQLREAALRYAAAGWPVLPAAVGGKAPRIPNPHPRGSPERCACRGECGRPGHGVLDATTDPATIAAWWRRWPSANVAIATGAPGPDVVDIDVTAGKPGLESLARLWAAGLLAGSVAAVRTPSGGLHAYYAGSLQGNGSLPRHGVDFRGRGGYVIAPPSAVAGRAYVLVASGPATGLTVSWSAVRELLAPHRHGTGRGDGPTPGLDALVRFVARLAPGNRNNGLYWAACRAVESDAATDVFDVLVDAAVSVGLSAAEARRTVESARRRAEATS